MASYAALFSLAKSLDRFLDHDRHHNDPRETQQIQSLREKIVSLAFFLDDFPREDGEFEARMTLAANRAEDIFDYYNLNKNGPEKGRLRSTALSCFRPVPLSPLENLYKKLQKPIKEIDSVFKQVMEIKSSRSKDPNIVEGLEEGSMDIKGGLCGDPFNGEDTVAVVGFEEDLLEIIGRLCGEPPKLQVIPIVGMAGIGKTTLARYAYDDPLTVCHFDVRVRVTISQDFHLRRFLLSLMRSFNTYEAEEYEWVDNESIVERGHKYLKQRRYLIVMDDMWNTNVWDDVRRIFPDDGNGSRIIVTTRDLDVASYVDSSSHPHKMNLMSVDQSWDLLRQKMFARDNCLPELEKIGKSIAENCRGLPLAVVVIAGVLSKVDQTQDCWKNIAENVREAVNTSDEQITGILSLSYAHLPHRLRPCFLYIGGFPEDHEINVSKLIKLWIAEGFLRSNGTEDLEVLGEKYLEDLAKRSLVLINKKRYDGKIKTIKLHDLLRDLCLRIARDEKFLHAMSDFSTCFPQRIKNSRRLSILSNISGVFPSINGSLMHTLLIFHHWAFDAWKVFKLLTVVDAMSVTFLSYPDEIEELCFLTYLAVAYEANSKGRRGLPTLPESSCNLQNLQTLIIKPSSSFGGTSFHLPFGMWRMPQLRHLIILDGFLPDPDSDTCGQILALENLQTLSRIRGFVCSQRILEMIPNLKKLAIVYGYGDVYESGWSKYGLKNLVHLCKLEKLSINAEPYPNLKNDLSQNVAFPITLKRLTLRGCRFPWSDMTCIGSLPNLEVLKLRRRACDGTDWETNEGEFSQLKVLLIDSTDLRYWITESSHFPSLERLVLYECNDLSEIPYGIGEIPTLESIEVDARNSTIVESAKCIKEEQQSFGNELKVHLLQSRSWTT